MSDGIASSEIRNLLTELMASQVELRNEVSQSHQELLSAIGLAGPLGQLKVHASTAVPAPLQGDAPLDADDTHALPSALMSTAAGVDHFTSTPRKAGDEPPNFSPTKSTKSTRSQRVVEAVREVTASHLTKLESQDFGQNVNKESLQDLLLVAEEVQDSIDKNLQSRKENGTTVYWYDKFRNMTKEQHELAVDSVMGFIILANALVIGFSMDLGGDDDGKLPISGWFVVDMGFVFLFLVELGIKIRLNGLCKYFSNFANWFDFLLIVFDLIQVIFLLATVESVNSGETFSASIFRVVRLLRLTRLVRVLRSSIYKDLMAMIQGMVGGLATLVWAMVLFILVIYVISLVCRETLGRQGSTVRSADYIDNVMSFFDSVPRSMFTIFRCSFGDCSTRGGTPIPEWMTLEFGGVASILFCVFIFSVTIGLFNVISAIFVESTMAAAAGMNYAKKMKRMRDKKRWSLNVSRLIALMLEHAEFDVPRKMSESVDEIVQVEVECKIIDKVVKDPEVIKCLVALDIDQEDHPYLSDILDPDNGGTIPVMDFVEGIRRLRGDPRRSDIVTVDMMVRSLQATCDKMAAKVDGLHTRFLEIN